MRTENVDSAARMLIDVRGVVQGVGFRPFIYNLAQRYGLKGFVCNDSLGVHIDVQGQSGSVEGFLNAIRETPPPLSRIESLSFQILQLVNAYSAFQILESESREEKLVLLSPDIAVCDECLEELFDPSNRRYRYPFLNCTNCGPRFTIIQDVPYDRKETTMSGFPMCIDCEGEYSDPSNRRFHAQPNACSVCGPQLAMGAERGDDALAAMIRALREGKIAAIKGLGGYHLACDALNPEAVQRLRSRKYREEKPFALMARDVTQITEFCEVSELEASLLLSRERPIVLLRNKESLLPETVAPGLRYLGWMLPYSPLHYLLMHDFASPIVLTSGNMSDEPIAYKDEDAAQRLHPIADVHLTHNREIHIRCDDSVARIVDGRPAMIRRSRGFAPDPIVLAQEFSQEILACGAELKNTFCLTRGNYAFLSHHIGDLENLETLDSFQEGIEHYRRLFDLNPVLIAHDLHPEYLSTKYALDQTSILKKIGVQHHHAHIASCMAENDLRGEVIGVAMDGLGYGTDDRFWGGEFLIADYSKFERAAHLEYLPMPGGSLAIREPWRMTASYLHSLGLQQEDGVYPWMDRVREESWRMVRKMMIQNLNCPLTSSMGRCFDAVASLLGIRDRIQYEGEAAIELEMIADETCEESYDLDIGIGGDTIELSFLIRGILRDLTAKIPPAIISSKFHNTIVNLITQICSRIRVQKQLNRVALSGGVFQNQFLLERVLKNLTETQFNVYIHHRVPTNDGGISLGQAVIANAQL